MYNSQSMSLEKFLTIFVLIYDFNNYLLVNLNAIISLASIMDVACSTYHELHHMDGKNIKSFVTCESASGWRMRYLICKQPLGSYS